MRKKSVKGKLQPTLHAFFSPSLSTAQLSSSAISEVASEVSLSLPTPLNLSSSSEPLSTPSHDEKGQSIGLSISERLSTPEKRQSINSEPSSSKSKSSKNHVRHFNELWPAKYPWVYALPLHVRPTLQVIVEPEEKGEIKSAELAEIVFQEGTIKRNQILCGFPWGNVYVSKSRLKPAASSEGPVCKTPSKVEEEGMLCMFKQIITISLSEKRGYHTDQVWMADWCWSSL
jgi:hypothetical protein